MKIIKKFSPCYVIEITPDEARTLRDIFNAVGGVAEHTRRGLTDNMNAALRDAGVQSALDETGEGAADMVAGSAIRFE